MKDQEKRIDEIAMKLMDAIAPAIPEIVGDELERRMATFVEENPKSSGRPIGNMYEVFEAIHQETAFLMGQRCRAMAEQFVRGFDGGNEKPEVPEFEVVLKTVDL